MTVGRFNIGIIFIVYFVSVDLAAIRGKAPLCRDPDTGKLYQVNATWPSSSFCGNYTCKLRKINNTRHNNVLLREFKVPITKVTKDVPVNDQEVDDINEQNEEDKIKETGNNIQLEKQRIVKTKEKPNLKDILKSKVPNIFNSDNVEDRYLTQDEIKNLATLLQTVKKSDLDAIIDIYNIAQEIYNEIDSLTDENNLKDTINELKQTQMSKPNSYFYEPQKGHIPVTARVDITVTSPRTITVYPLSLFHRQASYINPRVQSTTENPCKNNTPKQTYLLPYPFTYIHHYNGTYPSNIFYNNPWLWDYYRRRNHKSHLNAIMAEIPKTVLVNSYLDESPERAESRDHMMTSSVDEMPDWKTEPLPPHVLDEVSAKIPETKILKPFPLKKKVVLEKVTKYIKMNERSKREVDDDDYEAYVEKTTCVTTTMPGFFRYGNMSQPYPHCCPQLIRS